MDTNINPWCPEFVSKYPNGSLRKQVDDKRKAK